MLEGRLDDFSLPDVFQLLALTGKTGTLRLRYADTAGAVIFRAGRVVGAFDDVRRTAPGTRMFASGLIDESQLETAIEASEAGAEGGVVGALVAAGAVDEDTVAEFRRQQAEDAVFALMRLSEATFSIEAGEVPPLPGEVELNTEQLIVEGGRRLGEWTEIRRRVPGRQSVPALVPVPPGEGPVTVGRDQWRLLALIDGRRTVADLVDLLGSGEYTTSAELSGLVDAGMITVGDRATHAQGARTRGERLREFEARELGLMRDDPGATPEVAPLGAPADAGDAAAGDEDDDDTGRADEGHAGEDQQAADAGTDTEDDEDEVDQAETPDAQPRRSTLQATLVSGIEIYDDLEDFHAAQRAAEGGGSGEPASSPPARGSGAGEADAERSDADRSEAEPAGSPRSGAEPSGSSPSGSQRAGGGSEPAEGQPTHGDRQQPQSTATPAGDAGEVSQAPPPPSHGPLPAPQDRGGQGGKARGEPRSASQTDPEDEQPALEGLDEEADSSPTESGLTRDEDINKALLLRLIDGVKGV